MEKSGLELLDWNVFALMIDKGEISPDELIGQALREHLFLRQFRLLRERMTPRAKAQGIVTDQDVFDRVS